MLSFKIRSVTSLLSESCQSRRLPASKKPRTLPAFFSHVRPTSPTECQLLVRFQTTLEWSRANLLLGLHVLRDPKSYPTQAPCSSAQTLGLGVRVQHRCPQLPCVCGVALQADRQEFQTKIWVLFFRAQKHWQEV